MPSQCVTIALRPSHDTNEQPSTTQRLITNGPAQRLAPHPQASRTQQGETCRVHALVSRR
ncbi:MAG: hypothetical protein ONB46_16450 [candidate division KSB1 bacterium]|nr:hypothetical protein [candidate division KSB1 bacterium]